MGESEGEKEDEPKVEEEEEELGMQNSMNIFFFWEKNYWILSVLNINSGVIFVVFFFVILTIYILYSIFFCFCQFQLERCL